MQRAFNYYIGLISATWILLWITHFAVEPRINISNVYTREAIIITVVLVLNTVLLLLTRFNKTRVITIGSMSFLVLTMILYCYLVVGLIRSKSIIYNLPFYIAYLYCLVFSGVLFKHETKKFL